MSLKCFVTRTAKVQRPPQQQQLVMVMLRAGTLAVQQQQQQQRGADIVPIATVVD